jgi:peptide/nickel transport system permease protein
VTAYVLRRLSMGLLVLFLVTLFMFVVMRLLPGAPLMLYIGQNELGTFSPEQLTQLQQQYGLDKPLPVQYFVWIGGVFGIGSGTIYALRRGKWQDSLFTVLANIGITLPGFWVGILLIYLFSLKLGWLPAYGYTSPFKDFITSFRQLIMPVFCLSLFAIASLTRQTRSSMLEAVPGGVLIGCNGYRINEHCRGYCLRLV